MSKPLSLAVRLGLALAVLGFAALPAAAHDARTADWRGNAHAYAHAAAVLPSYGNRNRRSTNRLISDVRAGRVACYQRASYRHRPFYLRSDIRGTRIGAHTLKRLLRRGHGIPAIDCYRVF